MSETTEISSKNTDFERINFTALSAGTVKVNYRTKADNKHIVGICIDIHNGDLATIGSTIRMLIDHEEVIPANFEAGLFAFSQDTPVDSRFFNFINRDIDQSDIQIEFTDNGAGYAGPVSVILKCINE